MLISVSRSMRVAGILLVLLLSPSLYAQKNSYLDSTRPSISSDAAIQQRRVLQTESGYDGYSFLSTKPELLASTTL